MYKLKPHGQGRTLATHPHLALLWPLLELDAEIVEPLTRGLEIIDSYTDVTKASSGVFIARCVAFEALVGFWYQHGCKMMVWHPSSKAHRFRSCGTAPRYPPYELDEPVSPPCSSSRNPCRNHLGKQGNSW
jgi:hypothetical protein